MLISYYWTKALTKKRCSLVGTPRIFAGNLDVIVMQDRGHVKSYRLSAEFFSGKQMVP